MKVRGHKLALELPEEVGDEMPAADHIPELDSSLLYQAYSYAMDEYQS
jgi:hypothetical protein